MEFNYKIILIIILILWFLSLIYYENFTTKRNDYENNNVGFRNFKLQSFFYPIIFWDY